MVRIREDSNNGFQGKFLLVVDGNESSSSGLKALLKQFRYKVWIVPTAAEALELSDIVMPALVVVGQIEDMSQADFIQEFKRLDSSGKATILVVMHGNDAAQERACLASGAITCLKVPLNVEALYRTIQVAIESVPRMNMRINAQFPVFIDDKNGSYCDGAFATALSENGLFLLTAEPCALNTKMSLKFKVDGKTLSVDAVVIYAYKQGNRMNFTPGMGLQFVRISDEDQQHIRIFIREEVRKGISAAQRA
jgi:CheY-like chemotaxis protein